MTETTKELPLRPSTLTKSKSDKNKDLPNYCFRVAIKNANGVVKEHIFPKALDLNRPKRARTTFSLNQLSQLEKEFYCNEYVTGKGRTDLAKRLQLSEEQVKVWFQNRRTKCKNIKNQLTTLSSSSSSSSSLTSTSPITAPPPKPLTKAACAAAREVELQSQQMNQALTFLMKLASSSTSCTPNYLPPQSFDNYPSCFPPHSVPLQRFSHPIQQHFRQPTTHQFPYPTHNYHPLYLNQTHNANVAAAVVSNFQHEHRLMPPSMNMCYPITFEAMQTIHRL